MRRYRCACPAHGVQRREGFEQRLDIIRIDSAFALDPFPILRPVPNNRFLAIGHARDAMNFLRFEFENRQLLPLQRISRDLAQEFLINRDDERLFADTRVNVRSLDFAER